MSEDILQGEKSVLGKRWFLREADERQVSFYQQKFSLPEVVARLLVAREISETQVPDFLEPSLKNLLPDPYHLKDMDKAIDRLEQAIQKKQKIAIFGDYDVDGATSSSLLKRYLQDAGHDGVTIYIPDRIDEGYGPNPAAMRTLKDQGNQLVVTVDCGTTSFEALDAAKGIGLDVIIIDHHIAEPKLPEAVAVVNPNRLDQTESPCRSCAAVGVTFVVLVALHKRLKEKGVLGDRMPDLLSYLDLVATGTVCDVVALQGLNRAFVKQGLKVMGRRQNQGLKALADNAGIDSFPNAYHLGFLLGPRINAGGRVGNASLGAELLSSHDDYRCRDIAQQLSTFNEERKAIEAEVLEEAFAQSESQEGPMVVAAGEGWHPGVIGIVAGRLKEKHHKPSCVIALDKGVGKGSLRSVPGVDIGSMIQAAKQSGLLEAGGGHAMAGGLTILEDKIPDFTDFMIQRIDQSGVDLTPYVKLDAILSAQGASIDLGHKLEMLAPFGQGNATPRFLFNELTIIKADIVGQNHVRCLFGGFGGQSRLSGISFRAVDTPLGDLLLNAKGKWLSAIGTLKLDEWNGMQRLQFTVEDAVQVALQKMDIAS